MQGKTRNPGKTLHLLEKAKENHGDVYEVAYRQAEKEKDVAQTATREVADLLSWADTFDEANAETKHMIIARLVERIEISHDYEVEIKFRISDEKYMRIAA